jgi:hypothetical protein
MDRRNAMCFQFVGWSNAGQQQKFGRVDRTGAYNYLTPGPNGLGPRRAVAQDLGARGSSIFDDYTGRPNARLNRQVLARHGWIEKSDRGTRTPRRSLRYLIEPNAILARAVEGRLTLAKNEMTPCHLLVN